MILKEKIRKLLFVAIATLCITVCGAQAIVKGSGVVYTNGAPTHAVSIGQDAEIAIDTSTGLWHEYNRDLLAWQSAGFRVRRLLISVAPTAAPGDKQSEVVVNNVDSLYHWRAGTWRHINKLGLLTVTTTSALSGSGTIGSPLSIAQQAATSGQVLAWNGTTWVPQTNAGANTANLTGTTRTTVTNGTGVVVGTSNVSVDVNESGLNPANITISDGGNYYPTDNISAALQNLGAARHDAVTVTDGTIIDLTVTGQDITATVLSGSLTLNKLGQNGATTGQSIRWNGTAWEVFTPSNGVTNLTTTTTATTVTVNSDTGTEQVIPAATITAAGVMTAANLTTLNDAVVSATDGATIDFTETVNVLTAEVKPVSLDSTHIKDGGLELEDLSRDGAATGQVPKWNGTAWVPQNDNAGSGALAVPNKEIVYGTGAATTSNSSFLFDNGLLIGQSTPDVESQNYVRAEYTTPQTSNKYALRSNIYLNGNQPQGFGSLLGYTTINSGASVWMSRGVYGAVDNNSTGAQTKAFPFYAVLAHRQNGSINEAVMYQTHLVGSAGAAGTINKLTMFKANSFDTGNSNVLEYRAFEVSDLNGLTNNKSYGLYLDSYFGTKNFIKAKTGVGYSLQHPTIQLQVQSIELDSAVFRIENAFGIVDWYIRNSTPSNTFAAKVGAHYWNTSDQKMYIKRSGIGIAGWEEYLMSGATIDLNPSIVDRDQRINLSSGSGGGNISVVRMGTAGRDWEYRARNGANGYRFDFDYIGTDAPIGGVLSLRKDGAIHELNMSGGGTGVMIADNLGMHVKATTGAGLSITGTTITNTGDTDPNNDITTATSAAGDVAGLFSNLQIGANTVGATELSNTAVTAGTYPAVIGTSYARFDVDADGRITSVSDFLLPDASNLNEGLLGVADGFGGNVKITSNSVSAAGVQLQPGLGIVLGKTNSTNGGLITIAAVDESNNNEGLIGVGAGNANSATIVSNSLNSIPLSINATNALQITEVISTNGGSINLDLAQNGATAGQVLKWTGGTWAPAADAGTTYTAGAGIGISGVTISATDAAANNEGLIGVGAGNANTALITSNTSGANGVLLVAGQGLQVSETPNANGGDVTLSVANSGVTAGTYNNATVTVDITGRVTAATSGSFGPSTTTLDEAYNNFNATNSIITVDGAQGQIGGGLEFESVNAQNITVDLQGTGDFFVQDAGAPIMTIRDDGFAGIGLLSTPSAAQQLLVTNNVNSAITTPVRLENKGTPDDGCGVAFALAWKGGDEFRLKTYNPIGATLASQAAIEVDGDDYLVFTPQTNSISVERALYIKVQNFTAATVNLDGSSSMVNIPSTGTTTTVNLPEIVAGPSGLNQVGIGYVLDLIIDRNAVVTISRTGSADLIAVNGQSGATATKTTTANIFFARRLVAIGLDLWLIQS
ncbi:MAG: beta strand repeat-containing protein [Shewanella sp.]